MSIKIKSNLDISDKNFKIFNIRLLCFCIKIKIFYCFSIARKIKKKMNKFSLKNIKKIIN